MLKSVLSLTLLSIGALATTPHAPDPTIVAVPGEGYYVFATGRGLPIYHSDDLRSWREIDRVFDDPAPAWAVEAVPGASNIWAPDIVRVGDRYYCYYAVSTFGGQRSVIGLAVNTVLDPDHPDYKWEDRGLVIDSDPARDDFNAIDSAYFQDDDGTAYLFWGSYWTGLKVRRVDPATGKPDPAHPEIHSVASRVGQGTSIEAPYVVKRGGYYYLFVSWGKCCDGADSTYKVMVGRAAHVLGPYADFKGTPMMEGGGTLVLAGHGKWRGPGHNGVLMSEQGDWMVHHTYDLDRIEDHRVLQVRPMYWTEDGWPVVGEPLLDEEESPSPQSPAARGSHDPAPPATEGVHRPTGTWLHSVDYDDANARKITLRPDGRIGRADSPNTWTVEGDTLTLRWAGPNAPGGAWEDRVRIEPGGRSYIGRNQIGQVIRGVRE